MCDMASYKLLSFTTATTLQVVEVVKITSKDAVVRNFKVDTKENLQLAPGETFFGGDQEIKGFV